MGMINPPGQTPANALKVGYDAMLRARAVLRDIYTNIRGLYNRDTQEIVNAIYMEVDEEAARGSNSLRITLKLPLTGAPVEGNTRMVGTEEAPQVKTTTFYRNNWGKAVSVENYGVNKLDQEYLGIYQEHVNGLGLWAQQYRGRSIRTTILERFSPNLLVGNTAAFATAEWNPHVFVGGLGLTAQPAYSSNMATYTNNIVNAIINASGGSGANLFPQTVGQTLNVRFVYNLCRYAQQEKIMPLDINGSQAYILTISPLQATLMSDPTWTTTTLGAFWVSVNEINDEKIQNWYGLIGMIRSPIGVDVYVVVDPKQPTVLPSGSAEPFGLTAGYVFEGDDDRRNLANADVRDTCYLLGKSSIAVWEPEKLHFVEQDEEYHRIYGHGVKGVWGMQLPIFDQQNPTTVSREYYGSVVGILGRMNYL